MAGPQVQKIFETMLNRLTRRWGYDSSEELVKSEFGGVLYHFGLNFMGGHTVSHTDEYIADGPGHWIFNLALQGDGLLYFTDHEHCTTPQEAKTYAVWQVCTHT